MIDDPTQLSWRGIAATGVIMFVVAFIGCAVAFAIWMNDLHAPRIAVLGSGNQLSLMVIDGPARLVLASGDDAVGYENALTNVRPMFARRVDLVLVAGGGDSLLVPLAAHIDPHTRVTSALGTLPPSPETEAFGPLTALPDPGRIRLGPSLTVTVETAYAFGADPAAEAPAWRANIERGDTRVVVLSDGEAAGLFPPISPVSVLIVSGEDPAAGWALSSAPALIANAGAMSGPDLRSEFADDSHSPEWGFRVFAGEALQIRFVPGGIEIPSGSAQVLG